MTNSGYSYGCKNKDKKKPSSLRNHKRIRVDGRTRWTSGRPCSNVQLLDFMLELQKQIDAYGDSASTMLDCVDLRLTADIS